MDISCTVHKHLQLVLQIAPCKMPHLLFFLGVADNNQHDIIDERYTHQLVELADEHHKEVPSRSQAKKLMKVTFGGRRSWILKDTPTVAEVIQVFPSLKLPSAVS